MFEFKEAKAKKRFNNIDDYVKPLPIPIEIIDTSSNTKLTHYSAFYSNNRVYVKDSLQAEHLYKHGCFGKGEFSRAQSNLNANIHNNLNNNINEERDVDVSLSLKNIPLMSREQFTRRKKWIQTYTDQSDSNVKTENSSNGNKNNSFHDTFVAEFLKHKLSLIKDIDYKPKCRIQLSEEEQQKLPVNNIQNMCYNNTTRNQDNRNNRTIIPYAPNFDPFLYFIKDIPNCIINENSCLMYEEAFFLCFGLNCLKVYNEENNSEMQIIDLWKLFSRLDNRFVYKYIVYHKLRSKGWVVRDGIKYGVDFLVYQKGPDYYHASYSIIVKTIESKHDSLASFAGLVRVNENASKEIIIFYVIFDNIDNGDDEKHYLNSPQCIYQSATIEFLVTRWVPEQNRIDTADSISNSNTTVNII